MYAHSETLSVRSRASPEAAFERLDDPTALGSHMQKPSAMMLGGTMRYELDGGRGRTVGSVIRMTGYVLGLRLFLEEVVIERSPPFSKTWETRGDIRLLVIGHYRMGFTITPQGNGSHVGMFTDYNLPDGQGWKIMGAVFAKFYARWCLRKMTEGL
ncbi:SRPBCC family protein [Gellertiella hungarica]|uniref:Polyketide cyclase n=1 Tax=Gellertiella hungarica TaxID=1572859 RepID=A0A7W6J9F3_9HYPH|nr:SRPBCC family protein [Gellertiella hungarica]MBB4067256.1 hypothetical protein [Gellertiella hungarica]